ncbi:uncharacterized protein LOC113521725 [Galleria mellonella]|uniref:Uncharacterized protein LOC113521725 n=1 Tax=Galleria mellonella TaxID=7137 RepID=A0A6J1X1G2_GALME|nr:uncharacterized protein LOC113521725 [Galleria mellonella]
MKSFVALVALVAVAVAVPAHKPTVSDDAQLAAVIAAIQSPSTDPATAALLEQQLAQILGLEPISVGPALVDPEPIVVSPPIVNPPVVVSPPVVEPPVAQPPVVVLPPPAPAPQPAPQPESNSSPLVQIILNINQAESGPVSVPPGVALVPEIIGEPVQIVEAPEVVDPVQIVEAPAVVDPVNVVDGPAGPVEPIIVAPPIISTPVITLPDQLN